MLPSAFFWLICPPGVLVWEECSTPSLCVCVCMLYVTLSLLPGHFPWGSDTAVLCVAGASLQASPHSHLPVFLQFHFTSKPLGPMRSALVALENKSPARFLSDMAQSPPPLRLSPSAPALLLLLLRQFCSTTSSCLCGVQWAWAWHTVGTGVVQRD